MGPLPARADHRVSILDRLLHHATVVINGDSYRMKDAHHRKEQPKPT